MEGGLAEVEVDGVSRRRPLGLNHIAGRLRQRADKREIKDFTKPPLVVIFPITNIMGNFETA